MHKNTRKIDQRCVTCVTPYCQQEARALVVNLCSHVSKKKLSDWPGVDFLTWVTSQLLQLFDSHVRERTLQTANTQSWVICLREHTRISQSNVSGDKNNTVKKHVGESYERQREGAFPDRRDIQGRCSAFYFRVFLFLRSLQKKNPRIRCLHYCGNFVRILVESASLMGRGFSQQTSSWWFVAFLFSSILSWE